MLIGMAIVLLGCSQSTTEIPPTEKSMIHTLSITNINLDQAYYKPGEPVNLQLTLTGQVETSTQVNVRLSVSHLSDLIATQSQVISLSGLDQPVEFSFTPPPTVPMGYGLDISVSTPDGTVIAAGRTAFDVLENWTQNPRYGFMTNFTPGRTDLPEVMASLARYHINGLQFYDWMYRHEQLLPATDPYTDLWSTVPHSMATIDVMIDTAHQYSIAAMPYTAVYASSMAFYKEHPDWAIFDATGNPVFFGGEMMAYMDPQPGSPWTVHLLGQFDQVLQTTAFDGIHLDQYGDPKIGYDAEGHAFDLAPVLVDFINQTKTLVEKYRPDGAVVFNAVTNWPVEAVAPSAEDFVYIEVWSPYDGFSDLHSLIVNAQNLSAGKPVVLAAYIDAANTVNARIMDAVIFASGGSRIELGEKNGMLAEAYFPNYKEMSPDLAEAIQHDYDFMVRYENVIGPSTQDITKDFQNKIRISGISTSPGMGWDKVWPIIRQSDGMTAISLVNLLGIGNGNWATRIANDPTPLSNFDLTIDPAPAKAAKIWLASPDGSDASLQPVSFTQDSSSIQLNIPSLSYWDLILIEWSK
jgi:dextranase